MYQQSLRNKLLLNPIEAKEKRGTDMDRTERILEAVNQVRNGYTGQLGFGF